MERRNVILLSLFGFLVIVSIAMTFFRFFIFHNYTVSAEVSCDPLEKNCFARPCESELASCEEGEKYQYYEIIRKKANAVSECPTDAPEGCTPMRCESGESNCLEIFCDSERVPEGEYCTNDENFREASFEVMEEENERVENSEENNETETEIMENETMNDPGAES